ncbi:hypothetical protein [Sphingobacterium siyangense]|jgi:hypothetical protein|uniref:hypothetical protein n=1 Tax=Sphingobacterium siyangense TaxID=459529 RepID=UPI003C77DF9A
MIIALLLSIMSVGLLAQDNIPYKRNFDAYSKYILEKNGIECIEPDNLIDLQEYFVVQPIRDDRHVGWIYGPVFQSVDGNCVIQYPAFTSPLDVSGKLDYESNSLSYKSQIIREIKAALGFPDYVIPSQKSGDSEQRIVSVEYDSTSIDFNSYVTTIVGKDTKELFNGDTIYIYDVPLKKPFKEKYIYCTGFVIARHGRASMNFKIFFTPEGKLEKRRYLDYLKKKIWYID